VGHRLINPGGLVKADETPLATVAARDPMHVCFDIDERTFLRLRRAMREGKSKDLTEPGLAVTMGLADEEGFPHQGRLAFMDAAVDRGKGTLRLRAVFPNGDGLLVPG